MWGRVNFRKEKKKGKGRTKNETTREVAKKVENRGMKGGKEEKIQGGGGLRAWNKKKINLV